MSKEIQLANNRGFAIVDDQDYDRLIQFKWHNQEGYAKHSQWLNGTCVGIQMHNVVLGFAPSKDRVVDHINGNSLDNRRENLRIVTQQQNMFNRTKLAKGGTSKYKGVYWNKQRGMWRAKITLDYRTRHLGYFESETEAAIAYDNEATILFGECAKLNNAV